jgi:chromosome partitioning protein
VFASSVLGEKSQPGGDDRYEIATLRHHLSLLPLAHDARKPMFDLRPADGTVGSMQCYICLCYQEFESLTHNVLAAVRRAEIARSFDFLTARDSAGQQRSAGSAAAAHRALRAC